MFYLRVISMWASLRGGNLFSPEEPLKNMERHIPLKIPFSVALPDLFYAHAVTIQITKQKYVAFQVYMYIC